jgi:hypothetical protein
MISAKTHAARIARHQQLFDQAMARNDGCRPWQERKGTQAEALVALANRASRMELLSLNLEGDIHATYGVRMPIPRFVDGRLVLAESGLFDLRFEESWCWERPPGWAPLGLWSPNDPFHPNCAPALRGAICLGLLPPGVRLTELVLKGFFTLTLQDVVLDESDPLGVLNPFACEFYRNNQDLWPLTREGFLDAGEERE